MPSEGARTPSQVFRCRRSPRPGNVPELPKRKGGGRGRPSGPGAKMTENTEAKTIGAQPSIWRPFICNMQYPTTRNMRYNPGLGALICCSATVIVTRICFRAPRQKPPAGAFKRRAKSLLKSRTHAMSYVAAFSAAASEIRALKWSFPS